MDAGIVTLPPLLYGNASLCVLSTLMIGGGGSLMLDLYGWESVFYVSGLLAVLWAYCMWKCLLNGEGKAGVARLGEVLCSGCPCLLCPILLLTCFSRADHHTGVPGKRWAPVQDVQETLGMAPKAACNLVRWS